MLIVFLVHVSFARHYICFVERVSCFTFSSQHKLFNFSAKIGIIFPCIIFLRYSGYFYFFDDTIDDKVDTKIFNILQRYTYI